MKCNVASNYRFTSKNLNSTERALMMQWWEELTRLYGTYVEYYTYNYQLSAHDDLYGEHVNATFSTPQGMVVLAELSNDSMLLSKFGIQTDADLTIIIPIDNYQTVYGSTAEPKSGDLIKLSELGWDRPGAQRPYPAGTTDDLCTANTLTAVNGYVDTNNTSDIDTWLRGPNVYEVTERRDENVPARINMLQGHYVWMLKCKRFDYSYQPNAPREAGSSQVSDETLYGKLSGGSVTAEPAKPYDQNTNADAKIIWDYENRGKLSDVYGEY